MTLAARNAEAFHPDAPPDTPITEGPGNGGDITHEGDGYGGGGGGGGGGRWITIATFSVSTEAHLARLKLENEGLPCVIVDEHLISTNWLLSPAIGGIKLQVPEELALRAREILGDQANLPNGWEQQAIAQARCQTCGKGEYGPTPPPRWAVILSILLLGIPLLFLPRPFRCDACGAPIPER